VYDLERFIEWAVPRRKPGEPRHIIPGGTIDLARTLPGLSGPAECFVRGSQDRLTIIGPAGDRRAVYFLGLQDGRPPTAERIEIGAAIETRVTACDAVNETLYIGVAGGELLRVDLRQHSTAPLRHEWRADVVARTRLPVRSAVQALAVGALGDPNRPVGLRSTVVYAVAGTDAVYRLTADLHLDERITIGTDANP